jgi:hypothetical protein
MAGIGPRRRCRPPAVAGRFLGLTCRACSWSRGLPVTNSRHSSEFLHSSKLNFPPKLPLHPGLEICVALRAKIDDFLICLACSPLH